MPKARPYQPSSNNLAMLTLQGNCSKQGVAMACGLSLLDTNPSFSQLHDVHITVTSIIIMR